MRTPATFVVARHLLSHPNDGSTAIGRHCNMSTSSASLAAKRIRQQNRHTDHELIHLMQSVPERPNHRTFYFQAQNPEQWRAAFARPHWLSGEFAAAVEGFDLVPERLLVYVHENDLAEALDAAFAILAKVAPSSQANLVLKVADPWLHLDPRKPLVERGQRLLDYAESRHIQILRSLLRA